MKQSFKYELIVVVFVLLVSVLQSCKEKAIASVKEVAMNTEASIEVLPKKPLSEAFKAYWYAGDAEITSYKLQQARYGEIREGSAVLIYVTEPFLNEKQVKADRTYPDNIPVLKLNRTKKYLTGIYPYSIMNSSFYPVSDDQHALKVSFSSQEWCGQVYAQLNNRETYEVMSHSYFETEADQNMSLEKNHLENELWNKIRVNPEGLPVGNIELIPSMEHIRLSHAKLKAYEANASLEHKNGVSTYIITYPELQRTLQINFETAFPHTIESWSDSFKSGWGAKAKILTSTATKTKTLKTPYWRQNGNSFLHLRDSLGL